MNVKLPILFCLLFASSIISAQSDDLINKRFTNNSQFLFNEYLGADIKLKSGEITTTDINYNVFFQEIWYKNNNQFFVLTKSEQVDYIELEDSKFIIHKGMILERIVYFEQYKILKYREIDQTVNNNNGGYGMSTVTGTATSMSSYITRPSGVDRVHNINNESDKEYDLNVKYFISDKNGKLHGLTKRKLYSLFESKKTSIKEFLKANKIDLRNEDDILSLFEYLESL